MTVVNHALTNALVAGLLGLLVYALVRPHRIPEAARWLWLIVLVKLVLPPLVPMPLPARWTSTSDDNFLRGEKIATKVERGSLEFAPAMTPELPTDEALARVLSPDASSLDRDLQAATPGNVLIRHAAKRPQVAFTSSHDWMHEFARLALWTWLAGSIACALVVMVRVALFERLLRRVALGPTADDTHLMSALSDAAERMQLGRIPSVNFVGAQVPPMVWPVGRGGRIILPCELVRHLSPPELRLLLAHELAHLKRRDHWIRWFETIVSCIYWWHPIVWLARRELRAAEEIGCDRLVLRAFSLPTSTIYGEALLKASDFVSQCGRAPYAMASGFARPSHLRRRIEMIIEPRKRSSRPLAMAAAMAFCMAMTALPLSIQPAPAQEQNAAATPARNPTEPATNDPQQLAVTVEETPRPPSTPSRPGDTAVQGAAKEDHDDILMATARNEKPFADPKRIDRYANVRTLAEALQVCHEELRSTNREEFVALMTEARVQSTLRRFLEKYAAWLKDSLKAQPDDATTIKSSEYFYSTIRRPLELLRDDGVWPKNGYFDLERPGNGQGIGVRIVLNIETPGQTYDGFSVLILDVEFGKFSLEKKDVHRSAAFEMQRLRIDLEEKKLQSLLDANRRATNSVSELQIAEQRTRYEIARKQLSLIEAMTEKEAAELNKRTLRDMSLPGDPKNDASDAALDELIRESQKEQAAIGPRPAVTTWWQTRSLDGLDSPVIVKMDSRSEPMEFRMSAASSAVLDFQRPINRAIVNRPELLAITPVARTQLQVTAKQPGVVELLAVDEKSGGMTIRITITGHQRPAPAAAASDQESTTPREETAAQRIRLMQERIEFLQRMYDMAMALNEHGMPGGEVDVLHRAGYELEKARAELAELNGKEDQARARRQAALEHAQKAFDAAQARYEAGTITQDQLLRAHDQLIRAKLDLLPPAIADHPPR
jgi:beta-lactamase regulating signal transducer with metallopeptidase domain